MTSNTGAIIRYRILKMLEEGNLGWGDIRLAPNLSNFDTEKVRFMMATLVDVGDVIDMGTSGYKITANGRKYLQDRQSATEKKEDGT